MFWVISVCGIPIIMILIRLIFAKSPPKKINGIVGYRTTRSMKTQETWIFANEYSSKLFLKWGGISLLISIMVLCIFRNVNEDILAWIVIALVTLQTIAICVSIIPVEKALKEKFDEQGKPRL